MPGVMSLVDTLELLGAAVAFLIAVWANYRPYGGHPHLVIMGAMLLVTWAISIALRSIFSIPEAWLGYPVEDLICGAIAGYVGLRYASAWAFVLSGLFLIQCGLHGFFWAKWDGLDFGPIHLAPLAHDDAQGRALKWWYVATLNFTFVGQLLTVLLPGGTHVAVRSGVVGGMLRPLGLGASALPGTK